MPQTRMEITLPSSWYLDSETFALEREHIFFRNGFVSAGKRRFPTRVITAY
jgi:hypothetical protein